MKGERSPLVQIPKKTVHVVYGRLLFKCRCNSFDRRVFAWLMGSLSVVDLFISVGCIVNLPKPKGNFDFDRDLALR